MSSADDEARGRSRAAGREAAGRKAQGRGRAEGAGPRGRDRVSRGQAGEPPADPESFWSGYDLLWGDARDPAATRRSPLDRTGIVRAALRVADAEGLAAVTMRRVASELGTGAMSLYRHVPGKEALVSFMIDDALGEDVPPGKPSGDWRNDLREMASHMWDFIQRHPWYPDAVLERPPITPRGVAAFEFALSILDDTGLAVNERAVIVVTMTNTVLAAARNAAAEARTRSRFQVTDDEVISAVGAFLGEIMQSGAYPRFRDVLTSAGRVDPKDEMRVSVELILDGAAARIAAAT